LRGGVAARRRAGAKLLANAVEMEEYFAGRLASILPPSVFDRLRFAACQRL
jgi:hypothetical protein